MPKGYWSNADTWEMALAFKRDLDASHAAHAFIRSFRSGSLSLPGLAEAMQEYAEHRDHFGLVPPEATGRVVWGEVARKWADHAVLPAGREPLTRETGDELQLILRNPWARDAALAEAMDSRSLLDLGLKLRSMAEGGRLPALRGRKAAWVNWYGVGLYFRGE